MEYNFEIFTLCDGAFNYDGRMSIIGTFDSIKASELPWRQNVGLAMKFIVPTSVHGEKKLEIHLLDPESNLIASPIESIVDIPVTKKRGALQIAVMLSGLIFKMTGKHKILVKFEDQTIKEFTYEVSK